MPEASTPHSAFPDSGDGVGAEAGGLGEELEEDFDEPKPRISTSYAVPPARSATGSSSTSRDLRAPGRAPGATTPGGSPVRNLVLGSQLRQLRERAMVTRAEAGDKIRCSPSKLSRMENGRVALKVRDVSDLLDLYGVTDEEERTSLLNLAGRGRGKDWWSAHSDLIPPWFTEYLGLEEVAQRIQTYEVQFVPGLLQCEEYMRALAGALRRQYRLSETDSWVQLRQRRQEILLRTDPPRVWAIINESALRRPIGNRRVMQAQFDKLLEVGSLPNVALQIIDGAAAGAAVEFAFCILRFSGPELPDIAYIEHLTSAQYLHRSSDVEAYSRAMDRLAVAARTPEDSRRLIWQMKAEF